MKTWQKVALAIVIPGGFLLWGLFHLRYRLEREK